MNSARSWGERARAQLEVAAFDRTVSPFARADDASAAFEPTFAGTNYGAAMAWARDLCIRSRARKKELHVLTPPRRARSRRIGIPADVEVTLTDLGRAFPRNVGVIGVSVSPEALRPRGPDSSRPRSATPRRCPPGRSPSAPPGIRGNEPIDLEEAVDLGGDTTLNLEFKLPEMDEALWLGQVEATTGDDLSFDDRRYLAIPVSPATRILLVDGDPGHSLRSGDLLPPAALRLAPEGRPTRRPRSTPRRSTWSTSAGLPDLRSIGRRAGTWGDSRPRTRAASPSSSPRGRPGRLHR
ncbi:MAG: hypothetical protein WKF75_00830 [Singulisphaera sp.]